MRRLGAALVLALAVATAAGLAVYGFVHFPRLLQLNKAGRRVFKHPAALDRRSAVTEPRS